MAIRGFRHKGLELLFTQGRATKTFELVGQDVNRVDYEDYH